MTKEECAKMVREWAEAVEFAIAHEELFGQEHLDLCLSSLKKRIEWLEQARQD